MNQVFLLRHHLSRKLCYAGLLVCWISAGCGDSPGPEGPRADVVMTITNNGAPVPSGLVDLINAESGDGGGGELASDGTVAIANVAFGTYKVIVRPPEPDPTPDQSTANPIVNGAEIPAQFQSAQTSPFTITVGEGEPSQDIEFDLKAAE